MKNAIYMKATIQEGNNSGNKLYLAAARILILPLCGVDQNTRKSINSLSVFP